MWIGKCLVMRLYIEWVNMQHLFPFNVLNLILIQGSSKFKRSWEFRQITLIILIINILNCPLIYNGESGCVDWWHTFEPANIVLSILVPCPTPTTEKKDIMLEHHYCSLSSFDPVEAEGVHPNNPRFCFWIKPDITCVCFLSWQSQLVGIKL